MWGCCLPYTQCPAHTSPALLGWLAPTFLCRKSFYVVSRDFHMPGLSGGTVTQTVSVVVLFGEREVARKVARCRVNTAPCLGRWLGCAGLQCALTPQEGH